MKNWWRKWSYEIPLLVGDALWDVLVVQFADFLSRLTVRRVLEFVVVTLLVMAFIQTLPIDLAFLLAGDTLMYLEFIVIVRLAAGKEHFLHMAHLAVRLARFAMRQARTATDRATTALKSRRERRLPPRPARPPRSDSSDDDRGFGAAWVGLAIA